MMKVKIRHLYVWSLFVLLQNACASFQPISYSRNLQLDKIPLQQLEYLSSSKSVATMSEDGTLSIWPVDGKQEKPMMTLTVANGSVFPAALTVSKNQSASLLAISSVDSQAFLFDFQHKLRALELPEVSLLEKLKTVGKEDKVGPPVFSESGKWLAIPSNYGTVRIWDTQTGKLVKHLTGHDGIVYTAAFSKDEKFLATASADGRVKLWDLSHEKVIHTFTGHGGEMRSVIFSLTGNMLIGGGELGQILFWDLSTQKELAAFSLYQGPIKTLSLSSSGRELLIIKEFGTAEVWDLQKQERRFRLRGHQNRIHQARFSPDGKFVISASDDKTARIWEVATGKQMWVLQGHQAEVTSALFLPITKQQQVVTVSRDGSIRLWNLSLGR